MGPLEKGDLLNQADLERVFTTYKFDAVMHFAARSLVGESIEKPGLYLRNNVTGTLNLLDAMRHAGINRLVFSSTAAVYGQPQYTPIDEQHPTWPINPYGLSKRMAEQIIEEYCRAFGLRAASLRYFNAAGADADAEIGEDHEPETHLIPLVIRAAIQPNADPIKVFGNDYDTPDGTCIRDYIHVEDLCRHIWQPSNILIKTTAGIFSIWAPATGIQSMKSSKPAALSTTANQRPHFTRDDPATPPGLLPALHRPVKYWAGHPVTDWRTALKAPAAGTPSPTRPASHPTLARTSGSRYD